MSKREYNSLFVLNKFSILFIFVLFFFSILISCTKRKGCTDILLINYDSEAEKDDESCEYGGEGGNNSIILFFRCDDHQVVSKLNYLDSAYVKYNAIDVPGGPYPVGGDPNAYDKVFAGNVGDSTIIINGLKKGKYIIYLTAYDSTFSSRISRPISVILNQDSGVVNRYVYLWQICCSF